MRPLSSPFLFLVVSLAVGQSAAADVILRFSLYRPGHDLHGLRLETRGHGEMFWIDAFSRGPGYFTAGSESSWSLTVSGGSGAAGLFHGKYLVDDRLGDMQGITVTSSPTGGYGLTGPGNWGTRRSFGLDWVRPVGDVQIQFSLLATAGLQTPSAGEAVEFASVSPNLSGVRIVTPRMSTLFRVSTELEFFTTPNQVNSVVPEASGWRFCFGAVTGLLVTPKRWRRSA